MLFILSQEIEGKIYLGWRSWTGYGICSEVVVFVGEVPIICKINVVMSLLRSILYSSRLSSW
jgi:hypothetical protein